MSWNGDRANIHFINECGRINPDWTKQAPDIEFFQRMHDVDFALRDLYQRCAEYAWTKENLVKMLIEVQNGTCIITAPAAANFPDHYVKVYKDSAERILAELESGRLTF